MISVKKLFTLLACSCMLVMSCKANVTKNADGTYSVESTVSQQTLQQIVTESIADPLVKSLTVSLQSGYVLVSGERARLNDPNHNDQMSFRLDLGESGGHLIATISNAVIDGIAVEQNRVDLWNQRIANRLALVGGHGNSSLAWVVITPQAVTMNWTVGK